MPSNLGNTMRPLRREIGFAASRRQFLLGSTAAGLMLPAWARSVHAAAPERLRLASVGVGGMGASDLGSLSSHPKLDVVALCDVDSRRLAEAASRHPKAKLYSDYRVMLDEMHDGIDAVQVSTPDHTHAPAAMTAMNHGKHVYCQKPLTHDVYEARQLRLAAEKSGVVTQMGTQIHSHGAYRTAVKLVQSGAIGKVSEVHSWSSKTWGYEGAQPAPAKVPEFLNWDLWLGSAPQTEYAEGQYHPANWRRWYDFGCGTMGDMAIHILDPVFSALKLGTPHKLISHSSKPPAKSYGLQNETRFSISATDYTTDDFVLTWYDGGRMPETKAWPEPITKALPDQGSIFIGERGYILLPHIANPVLVLNSAADKHEIEQVAGGDHYHLFVDACLGGAPTTAHFGYAGPLTESVLLGVLANRFPQQELVWDAESMTIKGLDAAQQLIKRTYREGFEVEGLS
jgi:predicted dehydrogenase